MSLLRKAATLNPCTVVVAVTIALGLGAPFTSRSNAQLQGRGTGWCTDHNGRNFRCRARTSRGASRNRTATIYNNRGVDLLNRGFRNKSLATVGQAISSLRRAYQIQAHWIHHRNLFAALTYYWTLKATKTSDCPARLSYMRNAMKTLLYHPAHKKRSLATRVGNLEGVCRRIAAANANRRPVGGGTRNPVTQQRRPQKGVAIGAAAAIAGNVQMCVAGRCTRLSSSGKTIYANATIKTGARGRIQILFNDETVMTLGPHTEIVLDKYAYAAGTTRINRGTFRFVSGKVSQQRNRRLQTPGGSIGIRGTDFVLRVTPRTRTMVVELLEGALSFKATGGQAERAISPGVWVIKWFERRTGRIYRIRRVRVYRAAGDRVLAQRRGYYDRVLPRGRKAAAPTTGGKTGIQSNQGAKAALLNPAWPVGRSSRWREPNGAYGTYTPASGIYPEGNNRCRQVSFIHTRSDGVRYAGTGHVCLLATGGISFGVTRMTKVKGTGLTCNLGGKIYPLGQVVNGWLKCMPNGVWKRVR
jgi:hypothetical protein